MNKETISLYDLKITVDRIDGRSVCGLSVGDYFIVEESSRLRIQEGKHMCMFALAAILPLLPARQRELAANDWMETDSYVACPDPDERVIFKIERIGKRDIESSSLT